jgi:hypothetical protein
VSRTLGDLLRETHILAPDDRDAAIARSDSLGSDVERAVREAATARRLGALADVLDQRLAWPRFRNRLDELLPERAAAQAELEARGPDHPSSVRLRDLSDGMRSADSRVRDDSRRALAAEHEAFMQTDLGRALAARAPDATLDAHVEELRAALDVARMAAAWASRAAAETDAEREARVIRETLADKAELLRDEEDPAFPALWGSSAGRAFRVLSRAGSQRLLAESEALRARIRSERP